MEVKADGGYFPVDKYATYRVAINDFLYAGGDGYSVFQQAGNYINMGFIYYEILADYIENHSPLAPRLEGRITAQSGP